MVLSCCITALKNVLDGGIKRIVSRQVQKRGGDVKGQSFTTITLSLLVPLTAIERVHEVSGSSTEVWECKSSHTFW